MASPTARTLNELRVRGWIADVVERWLPRTRIRKDFLGIFDVLALDGQPGVLGIQATDGTNASKRIQKLQDSELLAPWLAAGNRAQVWSWALRGPRGKRKTWTLRVDELPSEGP